MSSTNLSDRPPTPTKSRIDPSPEPYRQFLSLASFVASIGLGLSLGSSFSLSSATSFHGRSDPKTLASVYHSSLILAWSATSYGLGLVIALPGQVLVTSPHFINMYKDKSKPHKRHLLKFVFASMSWLSLAFVIVGTALVGEGLKLISIRAGQTLQWILLAIGLPLMMMWLILRHEKSIIWIGKKLSWSKASHPLIGKGRVGSGLVKQESMYNGP